MNKTQKPKLSGFRKKAAEGFLLGAVVISLFPWAITRWVVIPAVWLLLVLELANVSSWHNKLWDRLPWRARLLMDRPQCPGASNRILPLFVVMTTGLAVSILWLYSSWQFLLVLLINAVFTDVWAQVGGMLAKKRAIRQGRAAPKQFSPDSPNKTWVGVVSGLVGGALSGFVAAWVLVTFCGLGIPWFVYALMLGGPIVVVLGDLYESRLKREVGIKDLSRFFGSHGGACDRLDGLASYLATVALTIYALACWLWWTWLLVAAWDAIVIRELMRPRRRTT